MGYPVRMVSPVLVDPELLALWQRLQDVAQSGIRSLKHWRPKDGLAFAPPLPAHQHTMPTLVLSLSGVVRVRGLVDADLLPGDLLLVEPGCWHDHVLHKPGSSSFGVGFLAGRCDVLFFDHQRTLWGCVPEQPYRGIVEGLVEAGNEADRLRLVDELLAQVRRDKVEFVDWIQPGVLAMAAFLWNNLHGAIDAEDIIGQAGMGRTAAYDRFKEFFARSPKQELLAQRLDLARHLLQRGFSVTECAARCGFPTRADLTRAFRRRFGHPPTGDLVVG